MSALQFVVPGEPRGKGRPRFGKTRGGISIAYTDAKTASYENLVKLAARAAGAVITDAPLCVSIVAHFAPAPSWPKKRQAAALANEFVPGKFDVDNIAKAVLDGLNGVAFVDDKQVADLRVRKEFASTPGVTVSVFPFSGINAQSDGVQRDKAA